MAAEIQYRTARIDNREQSVDIKTVREEFNKDGDFRRKHVFKCPCCGEEMEAALGPIREDYFRHKTRPCSINYYLHSTAEEVFFEEYSKCLEKGMPFKITVYPEIQCNPACTLEKKESCSKRHKERIVIDLTRKFKKITPETRVYQEGRYRRPDLLLESESGEKLWVEIWVSHETVEEKRKLESILEVKIESHNDIETIRTHHLVQSKPSDRSIRFFDWKDVCSEPELHRETKEDTIRLSFREGFLPRAKPQTRGIILSEVNQMPRMKIAPLDIACPQNLASLRDLPPRAIPYWKRESAVFWVNLGLPSGTLWSKEYMGSMSFEEAQREFPGLIPSIEQYQELVSSCETTGLYPAGFIGPNGALLEMYEGDFWTNRTVDENRVVVFHREYLQDYITQNTPSIIQKSGFAKAGKEIRLCVRLVKKIK